MDSGSEVYEVVVVRFPTLYLFKHEQIGFPSEDESDVEFTVPREGESIADAIYQGSLGVGQ